MHKFDGRGIQKGGAERNPVMGKTGRPLKTMADVERIKFTVDKGGNPVKIGGHQYGEVFLGKVRFKDEYRMKNVKRNGKNVKVPSKKWHRVAIKRFGSGKAPEVAVFGGPAYEETIHELRKSGVMLPKMGMMLLKKGSPVGKEKLGEDEWVQVSQLFGATGYGSKIEQKSWGLFHTPESREFAVRELAKVCSGGRMPTGDLLEPVCLKDRVDAIPFDVDELRYEDFADVRAKDLLDIIRIIANKPFERDKSGRHKRAAGEEYQRLLDAAVDEASPAMKKALDRMERDRILKENKYGKIS